MKKLCSVVALVGFFGLSAGAEEEQRHMNYIANMGNMVIGLYNTDGFTPQDRLELVNCLGKQNFNGAQTVAIECSISTGNLMVYGFSKYGGTEYQSGSYHLVVNSPDPKVIGVLIGAVPQE